jgi:uncharacterized membrane protein YphA (DoxX/SURF4 family)
MNGRIEDRRSSSNLRYYPAQLGRPSVTRSVLVMAGLALLAFSFPASAHEKWFYDASLYPTRWDALLRPAALLAIGVAVSLTGLAWILWRGRDGRDLIPGPEALGAEEAGRVRFYALVPLILGVHLALSLIVLGVKGTLFSPNNAMTGGSLHWVGLAEIGLSLCFLYGGLTRVAGIGLGLVWLFGVPLVGIEAMMENLHYLGFAGFFFLAGRGPYAVDRLLFPRLAPSPRLSRLALPTLRVGVGLSLAAVAFTEKLANPDLARAFLREYPLNFTSAIGFPLSDDTFILCAGATELLIGLFLVFGIFPRAIIATAWFFINITLTVFLWTELLGHLPLYGAMGVLLVWTPKEEDQRLWARGVLGSSS